jgi:PIN domain
LILGSQVEMEYKKNRQLVILDSLGKFGSPEWTKLTAPALFSEAKAVKMIQKSKDQIESQRKKISAKIRNALEKPGTHDEVYQVLQRVFKHQSVYNLNRDAKVRFAIRNLVKKRFVLGYPPRKKNDTSIGDAINWEWIIHCAQQCSKDIVIASRDGDYGVQYDNKWYLNDWLSQEFKQRVSQKRKIQLTGKLSEALKLVNATVTAAIEAAEVKTIEEHSIESDEGS